MKIRSLHIEDYKLFKDFDIDFLGLDNKPLPIVVLAGVNGSGKTTILEFIKKEYKSDIEYFSAGLDDIQKVADEFVKFFYFMLKEKDYRPSEVKENLDKYMKDIFYHLDLTFKYSHLDKEDNVWMINKEGEKFLIQDLSTGEKTLLSKVLYLFFKEYKNTIILIDEPELSLHPSWQGEVLKIYENFARKNNCQIIIATHSPHIIGSAKNEYLRFLVKEDNKIVTKKLNGSPLDRDTNTLIKTLMGAEYIPRELQELRNAYRILFKKEKENTEEAKELEKEILKWESPNSSFWQGLAFDKELRGM